MFQVESRVLVVGYLTLLIFKSLSRVAISSDADVEDLIKSIWLKEL